MASGRSALDRAGMRSRVHGWQALGRGAARSAVQGFASAASLAPPDRQRTARRSSAPPSRRLARVRPPAVGRCPPGRCAAPPAESAPRRGQSRAQVAQRPSVTCRARHRQWCSSAWSLQDVPGRSRVGLHAPRCAARGSAAARSGAPPAAPPSARAHARRRPTSAWVRTAAAGRLWIGRHAARAAGKGSSSEQWRVWMQTSALAMDLPPPSLATRAPVVSGQRRPGPSATTRAGMACASGKWSAAALGPLRVQASSRRTPRRAPAPRTAPGAPRRGPLATAPLAPRRCGEWCAPQAMPRTARG
mmetsp:Transcript_160942/g.516549  ORF Transcript_160942/g.516549 Transcript_160942/m.516549 type:complete len:303 (-) Transcript_160942:185-1093(-)